MERINLIQVGVWWWELVNMVIYPLNPLNLRHFLISRATVKIRKKALNYGAATTLYSNSEMQNYCITALLHKQLIIIYLQFSN